MICLLGLAVTAAFWPGFSDQGIVRWAAIYVMVPIALLVEEDTPRSPNMVRWVGAALLIYLVASLFWTTVRYDGEYAMLQAIVMALVFVLAHSIEDARPLYSGLGLGLWLSVPLAVLQYLNWTLVVFGNPILTVHSYGGEIAGTFVNPNLLAEITFPVLVALLYDRTWWIAAGLVPIVLL